MPPLFGLLWAAGTGAVTFALGRYGGQISQFAPLYNMNTLVAVLVGLVVFGEWQGRPAGPAAAGSGPGGRGGVLAAASTRKRTRAESSHWKD